MRLSVLPIFVNSTKAGAMATSSSDDIPAQLAALLGNAVVHIRKTKELPPRVSIYDVIAAVTGLSGNHAGKAYRDLAMRYSEVHSIGVNFRFPGRGQRGTPVCEVRGIVEIIMTLPGHTAARVRHQAAELKVKTDWPRHTASIQY